MALTALAPMLLATAGVHASNTSAAQHRPSVLDQYAVAAVQPYRGQVPNGYDSYPVLRGAQIYIQAREGLTAEWLNLNLRNALAQHRDQGPAVNDLKVDVMSAGPGFWVLLSTNDVRSAQTVLSWARSIAADHHAQTK
jgi:hypothetical protein